VNCDRLRQAVIEVMGESADALTDEQLGFDAGTNAASGS
jgi:hypothetical protein